MSTYDDDDYPDEDPREEDPQEPDEDHFDDYGLPALDDEAAEREEEDVRVEEVTSDLQIERTPSVYMESEHPIRVCLSCGTQQSMMREDTGRPRTACRSCGTSFLEQSPLLGTLRPTLSGTLVERHQTLPDTARARILSGQPAEPGTTGVTALWSRAWLVELVEVSPEEDRRLVELAQLAYTNALPHWNLVEHLQALDALLARLEDPTMGVSQEAREQFDQVIWGIVPWLR